MAKLTGKKKAEFLARMEKGRRKAKRANPKTGPAAKKRKAAARKKTAKPKPPAAANPTKQKSKRNSEADQMYETFHGTPATRALTYDQAVTYHGTFAELGKLLELKIDLDSANREFPITGFGHCLAVTTADGENIYFVGGDQSIDLDAIGIGAGKDIVELGPCNYIAYRTQKHQFHDFEPQPYFHHLGEENGIKPMLCYDRLNQTLFFAGGDYQVKREGIVN